MSRCANPYLRCPGYRCSVQIGSVEGMLVLKVCQWGLCLALGRNSHESSENHVFLIFAKQYSQALRVEMTGI